MTNRHGLGQTKSSSRVWSKGSTCVNSPCLGSPCSSPPQLFTFNGRLHDAVIKAQTQCHGF